MPGCLNGHIDLHLSYWSETVHVKNEVKIMSPWRPRSEAGSLKTTLVHQGFPMSGKMSWHCVAVKCERERNTSSHVVSNTQTRNFSLFHSFVQLMEHCTLSVAESASPQMHKTESDTETKFLSYKSVQGWSWTGNHFMNLLYNYKMSAVCKANNVSN